MTAPTMPLRKGDRLAGLVLNGPRHDIDRGWCWDVTDGDHDATALYFPARYGLEAAVMERELESGAASRRGDYDIARSALIARDQLPESLRSRGGTAMALLVSKRVLPATLTAHIDEQGPIASESEFRALGAAILEGVEDLGGQPHGALGSNMLSTSSDLTTARAIFVGALRFDARVKSYLIFSPFAPPCAAHESYRPSVQGDLFGAGVALFHAATGSPRLNGERLAEVVQREALCAETLEAVLPPALRGMIDLFLSMLRRDLRQVPGPRELRRRLRVEQRPHPIATPLRGEPVTHDPPPSITPRSDEPPALPREPREPPALMPDRSATPSASRGTSIGPPPVALPPVVLPPVALPPVALPPVALPPVALPLIPPVASRRLQSDDHDRAESHEPDHSLAGSWRHPDDSRLQGVVVSGELLAVHGGSSVMVLRPSDRTLVGEHEFGAPILSVALDGQAVAVATWRSVHVGFAPRSSTWRLVETGPGPLRVVHRSGQVVVAGIRNRGAIAISNELEGTSTRDLDPPGDHHRDVVIAALVDSQGRLVTVAADGVRVRDPHDRRAASVSDATHFCCAAILRDELILGSVDGTVFAMSLPGGDLRVLYRHDAPALALATSADDLVSLDREGELRHFRSEARGPRPLPAVRGATSVARWRDRALVTVGARIDAIPLAST